MKDNNQLIIGIGAGFILVIFSGWNLFEIGLHITWWGFVFVIMFLLGLYFALGAIRDTFFPKKLTIIGGKECRPW